MGAVTAAAIVGGIRKAPGIISAARTALSMLGFGGNDKAAAARDLCGLVKRASGRLDRGVEVLELYQDSLDPATAILVRGLIEDARDDHEQLLEIARGLDDKVQPPTSPSPLGGPS